MAPRRALGQDSRVAPGVPDEGQADLRRGRLQTRQWDDKDGNKRYTTEIRGDRVVLLGGGGGGGGAGSSGACRGRAGMDEPMGEPITELTDDDIPF